MNQQTVEQAQPWIQLPDLIKNMKDKNFREEVILEEVEKWISKYWKEQQLPAGTTVYEVIGVENLPKKTGWYYVMNPNREIMPRMLQYIEGNEAFENPMQLNISYWLKETTIPNIAELSRQIESLQDQVIKEQEESKRLKGLMEKLYRMYNKTAMHESQLNEYWQQFKTDNQL